MIQKDYTIKQNFTVFIPTEVMCDNDYKDAGSFELTNPDRDNWLNGSWSEGVISITKLSQDLVFVVFDDVMRRDKTVKFVTALYRGELR